VEVSYGPLGLDLLRSGRSASETLEQLLANDERRDLRQVAMIDNTGQVATHTGKRCIANAGHVTGEGFSAQANMMLTNTVWRAMAEVFRISQGPLEDRLLLALEAAQNAGGDIRGQQGKSTGKKWEGIRVDLRVEDHPAPIDELRRLLNVQKAYRQMNSGDDLLGKGLVAEALDAYRHATEILPGQIELPFWQAVTLVDLGKLDEALPIFADIFRVDPNWAELVRRLPVAGLIKDDAIVMDQILGLVK
jgi:uncharacterized Ntn-hydrolase superfamily protein